MKGAMWWIDRWRQSRAFTDMTAEEQGLYRNLCDEVWLRPDHVIPDDQDILARVSGDPKAWRRRGAKVLGWMQKVENGWTNKVALEVIAQAEKRAEKQARYRHGRGNAGGNGGGNESGNEPGNAGGSPSQDSVSGKGRTEERTTDPSTDRPCGHSYAMTYVRQVADGRTVVCSCGQEVPGEKPHRPPPADHTPKANPFIAGPEDRDRYEREAVNRSRQIGDRDNLDPAEVLAKAAHYPGAKGQKVNPAAMSDDRLLNTVLDLRATWDAGQAKAGT